MVEFLEFQSIVQFRVPIGINGTLGEPQVTKKWTSPIRGAQHKVAKKDHVNIVATPTEEELY